MMKAITPSRILEERSAVAEKVSEHLENWQVLKVSQHPEGKNTDFRVGGLFNLLDMLPESTVKEAISLYIFIHGKDGMTI